MMSTRAPRAAFPVALLAAGVGNLAFHLAAARSVPAAAFADFGVLTALTAIATIPLASIEIAFAAAIARAAARGPVSADAVVQRFLRLVALPTAVAAVGVGAGIQAFLAVPPVQAALFALLMIAAAAVTLGRSMLIGAAWWRAAGVSVLIAPLGRLAGLLFLGLADAAPSATALLAVTVAGEAAAAAVALAICRRLFSPGGEDIDVRGADLGVAVASLAPLALLAGSDVILARLALPAAVVGRIAATANLARAALYLPQAVAFATLPDLSVGSARRVSVLVHRAVAALTGVTLLGVLALVPVGPWAGQLLLGDAEGGRLLPVLTLVALGAGLAHLTVTALIARRSRSSLYALAFVPLLAVGALLQSVAQVLVAALGITLLAAAVGLRLVARLRGGDDHELDATPSLPPHPIDASLSVVVPSFRPGSGFEPHLRSLAATCERIAPGAWEVIVVDDGCPERSGQRAAALGIDAVRVVTHPVNAGKGQAVRTGFAHSHGSLVGFIDADGDLDAHHVAELAGRLTASGADVVVGDKTHPASVTDRGWLRRTLTFGWGTAVQLLFGLEVADTQVGVKLWRGPLGRAVAAASSVDGFASDLELLVRSHAAGAAIVSAPVRITSADGSTVSARLVVRMAAGLVGLRRHLVGAGDLGRRPVDPAAEVPAPSTITARSSVPVADPVPIQALRTDASVELLDAA